MSDKDKSKIYNEFKDLVNMAPKELEEWLETDESKSVGQTREGASESIGHQSGKRIIDIKHTKKDDLLQSDYDHMQKVVSYISRHKAQGPQHKSDIKNSDWRYSLMNWGHDPLKN